MPTLAPHPASAPSHSVQAPPSHYGAAYLNLPRVNCCWQQAAEVVACGGRQVLEVGPGAGLTHWLLAKWGLQVWTVDLDPALRPSVAADIVRLPLADGAVDTVLAAEVLEHLPFEEFTPALRELRRVARGHVVITIPARLIGLSVGLNLPLLRPRFLATGLFWRRRHRFDGQHYWEMGCRGYGRRRIRTAIRSAGLRIEREFRPPLSLFAYGFVLASR